MALATALLLNPTASGPAWGRAVRTARRGRNMARRIKHRRARRRRNAWTGHRRAHAAAARKGWRSRRSRRRRNLVLKARTRVVHIRRPRRGLRRRRNPFGGLRRRMGGFKLVPSMSQVRDAFNKGAGAVGSEMVKGTIYSLIGRVPGSVAEDTVARIVSAPLTGWLAGMVLGPKAANAVVEGTLTVAVYKLVADVVASVTGGAPKLLGFIANPFTAVPALPLVPGFQAALTTPTVAEQGVGRLFGVVPEGTPLPLGGVIPEGETIPVGAGEYLAERFQSRF